MTKAQIVSDLEIGCVEKKITCRNCEIPKLNDGARGSAEEQDSVRDRFTLIADVQTDVQAGKMRQESKNYQKAETKR